jgi:signal transduction histidine kinase
MKIVGKTTNAGDQTIEMSNALCDILRAIIENDQRYAGVAVTEPRNIPEPKFPAKNVSRSAPRSSYYRWRASTATHSLSVRGADGLIELFLLKADDIPLLAFSEFGSRFKARFELSGTAGGYQWMLGKAPANSEETVAVLQRCLNELISIKDDEDYRSDKLTALPTGFNSMQKLMLEKENLIFKVLNQQEILKNELARSLHDTVLADLLMLKRHLRGDQELSKEEILETLDEIAQQLRDICNECAPRNLHDWGLKTSLQDMLQRMGQRTAIDCTLSCDLDIPNLPDTVELNIFRLVQECLNNIEKHAKATIVSINIERRKDKSIRFTVTDNGKGFQPGSRDKSLDSGGMGVSGMRERVDLIRCFFPTEFGLRSAAGQGTTVHLEITLPALD